MRLDEIYIYVTVIITHKHTHFKHQTNMYNSYTYRKLWQ